MLSNIQKNPFFSVLITVFNDERFLPTALDSLLQQEFDDYEVIIVDDCSFDSTPAIINDYSSKFRSFKAIRNSENFGLGRSLTIGSESCRGEFIMRFDSDDVCFSNRMLVAFNYISSHPEIDILGSSAVIIDYHGTKTGLRSVPLKHADIANKVWACPFIHPSVFLRRSAYHSIGGYDPSISRCCDYDLWFRAVKFNLHFHNIVEPLIYYRHDINTQRKNSTRYLFEQAAVGLRWCWRLKLSYWKYLAVVYPFIRGLLPLRIKSALYKIVNLNSISR
jgi:glycosyltransferase EpsE